MLVGAVLVVQGLTPAVGRAAPHAQTHARSRPNFIVILTDDQVIDTVQLMPHVQGLMQRGATFTNAIVSNPLCCPSRATILTGLYAGHTGVWTNAGSNFGGWQSFKTAGLTPSGTLFRGTGDNEGRTLPLYLQRHGYLTGLFGKYMNHYGGGASPPAVPVGWSAWTSFLGSNGAYYDYNTSNGGRLVRHGHAPWDYSTDVFGRGARRFLQRRAVQHGAKPFFLYYAPFAPHYSMTPGPRDLHTVAPTSFRTPAFNELNVRDKPKFVRERGFISARHAARMQRDWGRSYGTLRDVDRWIGGFERALPPDVLANTVFVFLSDNGFEWGDHRLNYKAYPYERSIRVPLVFAGPGIRHLQTSALAMNADLTPTILDLAHLPNVGGQFDGVSLAPLLTGTGSLGKRPALLIESSTTKKYLPSFCGLRSRTWKYVIYRGGFQELYDLRRDPFELHNLAKAKPHLTSAYRFRTQLACWPTPPDWNPLVWSR